MAYWSFNKIIPPAPNDPLVNVTTQLNNNWDLAEEKMNLLATNPMNNTLLNAEVGQEWIYNGRLGVWNGTSLIVPEDIDAAWTPWVDLALLSPVNTRVGFTPRWRNNTLLKQIQLSGCVITGAAAAWPLSFVTVTDEASVAGIPVAIAPNNGITYMPATTSIPTTANRGAGSVIAIDNNGGVSCRIRSRFMGASGGGNFVALDSVRWYY